MESSKIGPFALEQKLGGPQSHVYRAMQVQQRKQVALKVFSVPFAANDALRTECSDEMHLLTIHGILHLLGYDHAEPEEEQEMFGLQARLLAEWQGVRSGEDVE